MADSSYAVIGIDKSPDKINSHLANPRLSFVRGDIYTLNTIDACIAKCDIVISLAALCNPSLYNTIPLRVIENNFNQPCAIVDLCARHKKRLIHFSTCEVYGRTIGSYVSQPQGASGEPFNEDTTPFVLGPISAQRWTYACAKQLLERLIYAYGFEVGLEYTIVRPFNFIGPRMDFIPGIDGEGVPRVIACFMDALMFNKPLKLVDGGKNSRAFTAISDAVEAIIAIIENPVKSRNQVFNIGNPANETTIADLAYRMKMLYQKINLSQADRAIDIVNVSSEEFYGPGYEDSDRRIPDISKARRLLNWAPKTSLDAALSLTIESFVREYGSRAAEKNHV
jgi:UDP-apiose/xylose synthase